MGKGLGTFRTYIDVRQCKSAGDLAKEGHLLVVGLDQGQANSGRPDFDGKAGESGAGADIDNEARAANCKPGAVAFCAPICLRKHVASKEKALPEVAGDDLFRITDRGEIDAGIPAQQYIDVYRCLLELSGRQRAIEEWLEKGDDACGVHSSRFSVHSSQEEQNTSRTFTQATGLLTPLPAKSSGGYWLKDDVLKCTYTIIFYYNHSAINWTVIEKADPGRIRRKLLISSGGEGLMAEWSVPDISREINAIRAVGEGWGCGTD